MTAALLNCSVTGEPFEVSAAEQEYCRRYGFPLPSASPPERLRRMLSFVNYINLYRAECARTKRPILSWIPPESGLNVVDMREWEKDDWDPLEYGREFDFHRPFFEQFAELFRRIPLYNLSNIVSLMENSEYTNCIGSAKNCYLLFEGNNVEDVLFSVYVLNSRSIADSAFILDSELIYGSRNLRNCYNVKFSEGCSGCSDSAFLANCRQCRSCYGCVNLERREYCCFNEQLSRSQYEKRLSGIDLGSRSALAAEERRFARFRQAFPVRAVDGVRFENSSGNFISNSKNCRNSFFVSDSEDLEHCIEIFASKSSIAFASYGNDTELVYNCVHCGDSAYDLRFCFECWMNVNDLAYCGFCAHGTAHCFGCAGLKRHSCCILNKQYSEAEYSALLPKIKAHMERTGEWGRFFPASLSPHPYNLSTADLYLPLAKEEATSRGYRWKDEEAELVESPSALPDHIDELPDEATNWTVLCEETGKPYRLVKQEIRFYRQLRVPVPRIAPLVRVRKLGRFFAAGTPTLRSCSRCKAELLSVKSGSEILCQSCWESELS